MLQLASRSSTSFGHAVEQGKWLYKIDEAPVIETGHKILLKKWSRAGNCLIYLGWHTGFMHQVTNADLKISYWSIDASKCFSKKA